MAGELAPAGLRNIDDLRSMAANCLQLARTTIDPREHHKFFLRAAFYHEIAVLLELREATRRRDAA